MHEICRQGNIKDEVVASSLLPVEDAVFLILGLIPIFCGKRGLSVENEIESWIENKSRVIDKS